MTWTAKLNVVRQQVQVNLLSLLYSMLRAFLPIIIATLTGTPRYFPEFEWSQGKCYVSDVFRLKELVFGRKVGIVKESEGGINGITYYTLEAKLANFESKARSLLKNLSNYRLIVPVLELSNGITVPTSPYLFAIAQDGAVGTKVLTASPNTLAYTVTAGSVLVLNTTTGSGGEWATGATYNSVAMSRVIDSDNVATYEATFWFLGTPSSGSNTISVTSSPSTNGIYAQAYSGCSTTTPTGYKATTPAATTLTISNTSPATTAWGLVAGGSTNTSTTAGTNLTFRATMNGTQNFFGDSNGTTGTTGAYGQQVNTGASAVFDLIQMFLQVPASATAVGRLALLGVG